jgi:S-DNA-T family DNA segregation ATPase FtsK/SpoIIIE
MRTRSSHGRGTAIVPSAITPTAGRAHAVAGMIAETAREAADTAAALARLDAARDERITRANKALADLTAPAWADVAEKTTAGVADRITRVPMARLRNILDGARAQAGEPPDADPLGWAEHAAHDLQWRAKRVPYTTGYFARRRALRELTTIGRLFGMVERGVERWLELEERRLHAAATADLERIDRDVLATQADASERMSGRRWAWQAMSRELDLAQPPWTSPLWNDFAPQSAVPSELRVGTAAFHFGPFEMACPVLWPFPDGQSLLVRAGRDGGASTARAVLGIVLRAIASMPRGAIEVTFADPLGLGENVAPLMALREYDEAIVRAEVLTDDADIERYLVRLADHITDVNASYLRGKYATLTEHNAAAGEVAVGYKLFVAIGCPSRFTEKAFDRLCDVAENGSRAGVIAMVLAEPDVKTAYGVDLDRLTRLCFRIETGAPPAYDDTGRLAGSGSRSALVVPSITPAVPFEMDPPPDFRLGASASETLFGRVIDRIGAEARASRVRIVTFADLLKKFRDEVSRNPGRYDGTPLAPLVDDEGTWWRATSDEGLDVPIGLVGATKIQRFRVAGAMNHAAIIGANGTGKSTLLHGLIGALSTTYGPDELELSLVDMKNGVGFKIYGGARPLPHAKTVAVSCDRSVALDILGDLVREMTRRYALFKTWTAKTGRAIEGIAAFRSASGERMPRHVCVIDEFHDLTTGDDAIASAACDHLRLLAKEARAAGIHLVLATQNLVGCGLPKDALSEIAIRICFRLEDATASEVALGDGNVSAVVDIPPAEKGVAIYNLDRTKAGNVLFKGGWLDREADLPALVVRLHQRSPERAPRVFDGDQPVSPAADAVLLAAFDLVPPAPVEPDIDLAASGPSPSPVRRMRTRASADAAEAGATVVSGSMGRRARGAETVAASTAPDGPRLTPPPVTFPDVEVRADGAFVIDGPVPVGEAGPPESRVPERRVVTIARRPASPTSSRTFHAFLGQPMRLEPTLRAEFARRASRNMLVVTPSDVQATGIVLGCVLGVLADVRGRLDGLDAGATVSFVDGETSDDGSRCFDIMSRAMTGLVARVDLADLEDALGNLLGEIGEREATRRDGTPLPHLAVLFGAHNMPSLRAAVAIDASGEAGAMLREVLARGPSVGIHTVAWFDGAASARKSFSSTDLDEMALRVVAGLSPAEADHFVDGRVGAIPATRAVFRAADGTTTTFLPYEPVADAQFFAAVAKAVR